MKLIDLKIFILCLLFQLEVDTQHSINKTWPKINVASSKVYSQGVFYVFLGIQLCIPMTKFFSPNFLLWNEVAYSQTHVMMTTVETFSM